MQKETEKQRQKRLLLTRAELATKGSKFYKLIPCQGTLVNTKDKEGQNTQALLNYKANFKAPKVTSSTKLGNDRTQKHKTVRPGRYQPQMLTVVMLMKMTKKQREGIKIDRYYAFRPK